MDGTTCCRICLGNSNLTNLFNTSRMFLEKIMYCTSVKILPGDSLPSKICNQCTFYLDIAYVFKTVCEATDVILRGRVSDLKDVSLDSEHCARIIENVNIKDCIRSGREYEEVNNCNQSSNACKELNDSSQNCTESVDKEESNGVEVLPFNVTNNVHHIYDKFDASTNTDEGPMKISTSLNVKISQVGRHIAKKNAGQQPKRYNADCAEEKISQNKSERSETTYSGVEVLGYDNLVPEPMFEETILTEGERESAGAENNKSKMFVADESIQKFSYTFDDKVQAISSKKANIKIKFGGRQNRKTNKKVTFFNDRLDAGRVGKNLNIPVYPAHKKAIRFEGHCVDARKKSETFDCSICSKTFPFHSHLVRHLNIHTGIKGYACDYCKKLFTNRYNLSVHIRSHTGNFPIRCDICNRGFTSPSILKRHMRTHTGDLPYKCQYCLKQFAHSSSLQLHEKMHIHRPSYKCDICFKMFSYVNSLAAHKRTHSGYKAHTCSICYRAFTRNTSLMRHMPCHLD